MKWLILYFAAQLLSGSIMGQQMKPDSGEVEPTECPIVGADPNDDVNKREVPEKCRERSLPQQEEQFQSGKSEPTMTIVAGFVVVVAAILVAVLAPLPSSTGRGGTSEAIVAGMGGTSRISGFVPW